MIRHPRRFWIESFAWQQHESFDPALGDHVVDFEGWSWSMEDSRLMTWAEIERRLPRLRQTPVGEMVDIHEQGPRLSARTMGRVRCRTLVMRLGGIPPVCPD